MIDPDAPAFPTTPYQYPQSGELYLGCGGLTKREHAIIETFSRLSAQPENRGRTFHDLSEESVKAVDMLFKIMNR